MKIKNVYEDSNYDVELDKKNIRLYSFETSLKCVINNEELLTHRDITFLLKNNKTPKIVKNEFVNELKRLKTVNENVINHISNIDENDLVKLSFFEVYYITIIGKDIEQNSSVGCSNKFNVVFGDKVSNSKDDDVSDESIVLPARYERFIDKKYFSTVGEKYNFFKVFDATIDDLLPIDYLDDHSIIRFQDTKKLTMSRYIQDYFDDQLERTPYMVRVEQILLFPIWEVSFEYEEKNYISYLNDNENNFDYDKIQVPLEYNEKVDAPLYDFVDLLQLTSVHFWLLPALGVIGLTITFLFRIQTMDWINFALCALSGILFIIVGALRIGEGQIKDNLCDLFFYDYKETLLDNDYKNKSIKIIVLFVLQLLFLIGYIVFAIPFLRVI